MARAARLGRLPVDELLDTYTALVAAGQPELANPRAVDLTALVRALQSLPRGLMQAPRLLLVPSLDGFVCSPVEGGEFRCGKLPDGTLLGEVPRGTLMLFDWALNLCTLAHETRKAGTLLGNKPDTTQLASLAFNLGQDEESLQRAITQSGELLPTLAGGKKVLDVRIHPSLDPAHLQRQAQREADKVLGTLAELGLVDRPLHIWLGDAVITETLSPYCRELRPILQAWASAHPSQLGHDLQPLPTDATDDVLYAAAQDFMHVDPRLLGEKQAAERSVGIHHHRFAAGGGRFELIDMGRIDAKLCDARLPAARLKAPAPVLLRLGGSHPQVLVQVLRAVTQAVGARISSVTVVAEGISLSGAPGGVLLPNLLIRWGGGAVMPLPGDALSPNDFIGLIDRPVQGGAVLSAPALMLAHATLQQPTAEQAIRPTCVEVGSAELFEVLQQALWAGKLNERAEISWVVVDSETVPSGRPSLMSLRALSAVAVARLRRMMLGPTTPSTPTQPTPTPGSAPGSALGEVAPRRSTAWAVRLKA